jgi:hypothetical protein
VAEVPTTPEIAEFVANLVKGTRAGAIEWKPLDRAMVADLANSYRVTLEEIPDLDGEYTTSPDHTITLSSGGVELFTLNRKTLDGEAVQDALGERVEHSYGLLLELWNRARMISSKLHEHLSAVNRALDQQIRAKNDR